MIVVCKLHETNFRGIKYINLIYIYLLLYERFMVLTSSLGELMEDYFPLPNPPFPSQPFPSTDSRNMCKYVSQYICVCNSTYTNILTFNNTQTYAGKYPPAFQRKISRVNCFLFFILTLSDNCKTYETQGHRLYHVIYILGETIKLSS